MQYMRLVDATESTILKLMEEGRLFIKYGERDWEISKRRKPGKKVDMANLLKLQRQGKLYSDVFKKPA